MNNIILKDGICTVYTDNGKIEFLSSFLRKDKRQPKNKTKIAIDKHLQYSFS